MGMNVTHCDMVYGWSSIPRCKFLLLHIYIYDDICVYIYIYVTLYIHIYIYIVCYIIYVYIYISYVHPCAWLMTVPQILARDEFFKCQIIFPNWIMCAHHPSEIEFALFCYQYYPVALFDELTAKPSVVKRVILPSSPRLCHLLIWGLP